MDVPLIESSLLLGRWSPKMHNLANPVVELARLVVDGSFRDALTSPAARSLFQAQCSILDRPLESILNLSSPSSSPDLEPEAELTRLILAVACLHAFVQVNWTGPDLDVLPLEVIALHADDKAAITEETINAKAISELTYGGEPAYHLAQVATYLRLAQLLLDQPYVHCQSAPWWRLRAACVHQQILDEPVALSNDSLPDMAATFLAGEPDLPGRFLLEQGLLQHIFSQDKPAADLFVKAARATGLEYELTGALGKRTKFQVTELSQLVLLAESHLPPDDASVPDASSLKITDGVSSNKASTNGDGDPVSAVGRPSANVPETIALNDDTLLEQTEFTSSNPADASTGATQSRLSHIDPSSQPPLHPLDQCILLSLCLNLKNTSPIHGLTTEQMSPYISRVISHPLNWSIHTIALLLRSRLESSRTRTVERSTLQLQALIDQMPTSDSHIRERLQYFHALPLPSKWELERELALRFLSLGVVKSALEIFERLEMWEEVVKCYSSLEKRDKAIAIVRDLLEGRKDESGAAAAREKASSARGRETLDSAREAKLWCLLGDLEPRDAVAHYTRAWERSGERSGRAMRSLGGYYFAREAYGEARRCLSRAVAINPLMGRTWFVLGCACVREGAWEEGRVAFGRCVAIDEEDGESWNNLASMYLRLGVENGDRKDGGGDDDEDAAADGDKQAADQLSLTYNSGTSTSIPFANKLAAFRALKQGLRFSYDNWRMWYNYMVVAMDVGELFEASRALGRVVEERSTKDGEGAVDVDVLERLVDAVTKDAGEQQQQQQGDTGVSDGAGGVNINEGKGLLRSVSRLLEETILPRVSSSPRVFRAYARLLVYQGRWEDAIGAHLNAYRASPAGTMRGGEVGREEWREGVEGVEEVVDVLTGFGARAGGGSGWKVKARSVVRGFMGRMKEWEDEAEWGRLEGVLEELKKGDSE